MTEEQYEKAQKLKDESGYLVWEINLLEQAVKGGIIKVCLSREDDKYSVKIEGKKAAVNANFNDCCNLCRPALQKVTD